MTVKSDAPEYVPPVKTHQHLALRALHEGVASPEQQRIFFDWLLVNVCGVKSNTFRSGKPDDSAFLQGRRFVGLYLAAVLTKKPADEGEKP